MIKLLAFLGGILLFAIHAIPAVVHALDPDSPFIIDVLMGEPVEMETMLDDLADTKIIYLGEVHTIARHHKLQAEVLNRLKGRGLKLALGMEMFSTQQQAVLDRWVSGKQSINDLIRELGKEHWTNLKDYESVLTTARDLGIRVVGLNAPDDLVHKIAREGLAGLSPKEKASLPEDLEQIDPLNGRLLRLRLRVHKAFEAKSLDNIVLAQALRDATMARAVVEFLSSPKGKDAVMVVIAGSGHINYGFGIPERVKRRLDLPFRIILASESGELVLSEQEMRQMAPAHLTHKDLEFIQKPIADYLHVIPLKE
ncbi:MAG: ChaN family lipoprotein [Desulfomonilaceae bacterium]